MINNTLTHKLYVARQEAVANTDFSDNLATQGDFANKPSNAFDVLDIIRLDPTVSSVKDPKIFPETIINAIMFSFAGRNANDDEFSWKVYAWRNDNGPAELVCDGTGILGSQAVVKYPHNGMTATNRFWADTIIVDNERWMKEVEGTTDGGDSISKLWFDACGYRYFFVEITTSTGPMAVYVTFF